MLSLAETVANVGAAPAARLLTARPARVDTRTAKLIYQALALRSAFSLRYATAFIVLHRIPVSLWVRVLNSDEGTLRR